MTNLKRKLLCFKPLVANVLNPSEGLTHANFNRSVHIHSSCIIISKLIRAILFKKFASICHPVCFTVVNIRQHPT